jgi:hypothetical protein
METRLIEERKRRSLPLLSAESQPASIFSASATVMTPPKPSTISVRKGNRNAAPPPSVNALKSDGADENISLGTLKSVCASMMPAFDAASEAVFDTSSNL